MPLKFYLAASTVDFGGVKTRRSNEPLSPDFLQLVETTPGISQAQASHADVKMVGSHATPRAGDVPDRKLAAVMRNLVRHPGGNPVEAYLSPDVRHFRFVPKGKGHPYADEIPVVFPTPTMSVTETLASLWRQANTAKPNGSAIAQQVHTSTQGGVNGRGGAPIHQDPTDGVTGYAQHPMTRFEL